MWEPLNNIFDFPGNEPDQTPLVKKRIAAQKPGAPNVVMVSHGVNIAAIARVSPATAEMVIVRPSGKGGGMTLVGRIPLAVPEQENAIGKVYSPNAIGSSFHSSSLRLMNR